ALAVAVEPVEAGGGKRLGFGGRDGAVAILVDELHQAGKAVPPRRAVLSGRRQGSGEQQRGGKGGKMKGAKVDHCCSSVCSGLMVALRSMRLPLVASPSAKIATLDFEVGAVGRASRRHLACWAIRAAQLPQAGRKIEQSLGDDMHDDALALQP